MIARAAWFSQDCHSSAERSGPGTLSVSIRQAESTAICAPRALRR